MKYIELTPPPESCAGSYVYKEHRAGRTPIFDLNGITLSPPLPRSNAGVPLGGIGGGAIGRGFRGEFRRWSITPGRYRHSVIAGNAFSVRVGGKAVVLSMEVRITKFSFLITFRLRR